MLKVAVQEAKRKRDMRSRIPPAPQVPLPPIPGRQSPPTAQSTNTTPREFFKRFDPTLRLHSKSPVAVKRPTSLALAKVRSDVHSPPSTVSTALSPGSMMDSISKPPLKSKAIAIPAPSVKYLTDDNDEVDSSCYISFNTNEGILKENLNDDNSFSDGSPKSDTMASISDITASSPSDSVASSTRSHVMASSPRSDIMDISMSDTTASSPSEMIISSSSSPIGHQFIGSQSRFQSTDEEPVRRDLQPNQVNNLDYSEMFWKSLKDSKDCSTDSLITGNLFNSEATISDLDVELHIVERSETPSTPDNGNEEIADPETCLIEKKSSRNNPETRVLIENCYNANDDTIDIADLVAEFNKNAVLNKTMDDSGFETSASSRNNSVGSNKSASLCNIHQFPQQFDPNGSNLNNIKFERVTVDDF